MMSRRIPHLLQRDLAWGMGSIRIRKGRFQARWFDGERERAKTFYIREEAEDWLRMLARTRPRPTIEELAAQRRASYDGNFVYFIQSETDGLIKIGHARDPIQRLQHLQISTPSQLRIIGIVDGGLSRETALHEQFAHLRRKGEWFKPDDSLLSWIDSNATTLPS